MKRSEAISEIVNRILRMPHYSILEDYQVCASEILQYLENAGMRPPGYEVGFETGVADPTGVKEYYTEYYEEWEPEDDI